MDANGLRFWMVADQRQWHCGGTPPALDFDPERRHLRLARRRPSGPLAMGSSSFAAASAAPEALAQSMLARVPQARDLFGTRAYWDGSRGTVRATGALADAIDLWRPGQPDTEERTPTDLLLGHDGVLHVAVSGAVGLIDCRGRWPSPQGDGDPAWITHPECHAWRLAPHSQGGAWVLDRDHRSLWRLQGSPLASVASPREAEEPNRLCGCEPNPDPPRLSLVLEAVIPADEVAVGLATSPAGRLALLSWRRGGDGTGLLRLLGKGELEGPIRLLEAPFPWSLAWVNEERLAVRSATIHGEAPVYALPAPSAPIPRMGLTLQPLGDLHPLQAQPPNPTELRDPWVPGPFAHGLTLPPHYPSTPEAAGAPPATRPLDALPLPTHAREGEARGLGPREAALATPPDDPQLPTVDSGTAETVWHRLYLEAAIPANGAIVVELAASDAPELPAQESAWHPHRFGERFLPGDGQVPVGTWLNSASELPFHAGVLGCERQPRRSGLFTVLIQRPSRRVRRLQGRYLWVRVRLSGDGCSSPELAALRVYGSRFSYRDRYLSDMYHESVYGEDADQGDSRSTPADFLERFLAIGEGLLTPLEDRIAETHLLSSVATAPPEALDWLGSWIGVSLDPGWSIERRRRWLAHTPELYQRRGTLQGLELALDIASDGGVSRGAILVVEDFRLRRSFATILGATLADQEDPLLGGWAVSGNSVVGDTLILGAEARDDLLALFRLPQGGWNPLEQEAVEDFYRRLAHRATVLIHDQLSALDLGLIRRVVALESPAHVETQLVVANSPLLVGVASLVGIDTSLAPSPAPQRVQLDHSRLSRALLQSPPSLDPRLERGPLLGSSSPAPVAALRGPQEVDQTTNFQLEGNDSRAGPGRQLSRFLWRRLG
jgi:phage tail-like protein